jgi:Cu-Zn family superoxide dismutase
MAESERRRFWVRRTTAMLTATVSLAVAVAAAPSQPGWAQESEAGCRLHHGGTGANGTVAYEIPGAQPEGVGFDPRDCSFYTAASFVRGELYRGRLDQPTAHEYLPAEGGRPGAFGIEVDTKRDLLLVAGGNNGVLLAYKLTSKELHGRFETGPGGFLNDVAVAPNGDVYVTDSGRPTLYRIKASAIEAGSGTTEAIPLAPDVQYGPGFNANGLVVSPDGAHVVFAMTNSGRFYRVTVTPDPKARSITEVAIDRGLLPSADGLEIDGQTIYAVRNRDDVLVELAMSDDFSHAKVSAERKDPGFRSPTSVTLATGNRLLVAVAEYFNSDGPPYYVLNIKRP